MPPQAGEIFRRRLSESKNGYIFENPMTGKPFTDVKRVFNSALAKAGTKDFRFHDLRHTFGNYAMMLFKDIRADHGTFPDFLSSKLNTEIKKSGINPGGRCQNQPRDLP